MIVIAILGLAWFSLKLLDSTTPNSPGLSSLHAALPQVQHADMERLRERENADMERLRERERLVEQLKMQYHLAQKLPDTQEDRGRQRKIVMWMWGFHGDMPQTYTKMGTLMF